MPKTSLTTKKEHFIFWMAAFFLALFALVGWLRFQQTLAFWYYLLEIGLYPHPIYLAVSGGLIGIGYSFTLIYHLFRFRFTPVIVRILGILLIVWIWIDRIWIGTREAFFNLLPITILITACTISLDVLLVHRLEYKLKKEEHAAEN